jgi:4-hydroxybenzoate polyprenyltransferase
VLLLLGLALALGSTWLNGSWRPAIVGAVLATCVVAYDAALKKTVAGPLAMGACRALNALLGMSVVASADSPWRTPHFLIAGGLGVFVAGITAVGRKEARQSDRAWLLAGLFLMWGGMAMIAMFPYAQGIQTTLGNRVSMWPLVWLVLGLQIGWRILRTLMDPSPRHVQAAVQSSIVLLVVLDAIVTFAVAGTVPALVVLSLIVPTLALSRWLYMT